MAELPHLKCSGVQGQWWGDRDVRGCVSSWTVCGVMQDVLSFPTKGSCSKEHNLGKASTGDIRQAHGDFLTLYRGLGLPRPEHETAPWLCKALSDTGQHLPTKAPRHRTAGTNPKCQTWHQLTQPTPAWCVLPTAVSLKVSKVVSDTWKAKINHRGVCPWGKLVALKTEEEAEHSHRQQQHGCYSMTALQLWHLPAPEQNMLHIIAKTTRWCSPNTAHGVGTPQEAEPQSTALLTPH